MQSQQLTVELAVGAARDPAEREKPQAVEVVRLVAFLYPVHSTTSDETPHQPSQLTL
jgi:hypothetical protein